MKVFISETTGLFKYDGSGPEVSEKDTIKKE